MKAISKAELISMNACKFTLNRFIEQTNNTDTAVLISSLFNGKNTVADLIWLAVEICDIEKIRRFARDIALINIELIKPYCSDSEYKLILNFLKTGENDAHAFYVAGITAFEASAIDDFYATYSAYAAASAAAVYATAHAVYATASYAEEVDFTPYLQELFS